MVLVHTWNGARGMTYLLNLNLLIETILINVFTKYKYNNKNKEIEIFLKEGGRFKHLLKKEDRRQRAAED